MTFILKTLFYELNLIFPEKNDFLAKTQEKCVFVMALNIT